MRRTMVVAGWLWLLLACGLATPARAAGSQVCHAPVSGIINPAVADYLSRAVKQAAADCQALVITLNTPGGLMASTWQIGETLLNAPLPVVVYVAPQGAGAGSAGVFITYAAHVAAMAPNTNIGAAHPVAGGGEDIGDDLRDKITNDAVARITTWARTNARNPDWAEQAVRQSVSIGSDEALRLNVVNLVAADHADLLRQLDGLDVRLADGSERTLATLDAPLQLIEMSFVERMLHLLADPSVATMLISLGSLALYFELANPGLGVSGVLGGVSIVLGLYGLSVLPLTMAGVLLLVLSLILFGIDIFATNHGALTFGGIAAFVVGALLLVDTEAAPGVSVAKSVIAAVALAMGLVGALIIWLVLSGRRLREVNGSDGLRGTLVPVRATIAPEGMVFAQGALWKARSLDRIEVGDQAEIVDVDGLTLVVRRPQLAGALEAPRLGDGGL
ncbi:MAG TPA: nodulation protein NfeD [Herpetosiphonaceae bacterium]